MVEGFSGDVRVAQWVADNIISVIVDVLMA